MAETSSKLVTEQKEREIVQISRTVDGDSQKEIAETDLKISSFADVASYNWLDKPEPTILVPGVPAIWSPPRSTPSLRPDNGTRYIDQNSDRYPWSPLEPMVYAVSELRHDYAFKDLDVMSDRRPLRKLFGFVNGNEEDFEFGIEVVGKTVLMVRKEKKTREEIPPGAFQGFRWNFEMAYTKLEAAAKGSTSHHRLVSYRFGGFKLLVRSAVDAYLRETEEGKEEDDDSDEDDLVDQLSAVALTVEGPSTEATPEAPGITVVAGGHTVPHSTVLELKTRFKFARTPFNIEDKMPDLWITQTPNYIIAAHQNAGTKWSRAQTGQPRLAQFVDIDTQDMRGKLEDWEKANVSALRKLVLVLRKVVEVARETKGPCKVQYHKDRDVLEVSKADEGEVPMLSEELRKKWTVPAEVD